MDVNDNNKHQPNLKTNSNNDRTSTRATTTIDTYHSYKRCKSDRKSTQPHMIIMISNCQLIEKSSTIDMEPTNSSN